MVKGCVLVRTEVGRHSSVAKALAKLKGVKAAFSAMGRADVVAFLEARSAKELSNLCLSIRGAKGVVTTETLVGLEV